MKTSILFALTGLAGIVLTPCQAAAPVQSTTTDPNSPLAQQYINPNYLAPQKTGLHLGAEIRGIVGGNGQERYDGFDLPTVGGGAVDIHLEIPQNQRSSHEVSLNFSYMSGHRTERGWMDDGYDWVPGDLSLRTSSTNFALGYKFNTASTERTSTYIGAKTGISLMRYKEEFSIPHWGNYYSKTYRHNCFTTSAQVGFKVDLSPRVAALIGYEFFIPSGQIAGHHIHPYHLGTLGFSFTF